MPQGSLVDPLTYILLIDDLRLQCLTHKLVDDTTLTELLRRGTSESQIYSTTFNDMKINYAKTKKMILTPLAKCPPDARISSLHSRRQKANKRFFTFFKIFRPILLMPRWPRSLPNTVRSLTVASSPIHCAHTV